METASFQFNPRLLEILGRQYRSSELALKELVANAWDADATVVEVQLPRPLQDDQVMVNDNGHGMTPSSVRSQFMNIGFDRTELTGVTTPKGRKVRGKWGTGKLAGLELAEAMTVETTWFDQTSRFKLSRELFAEHGIRLEDIKIPIEVIDATSSAGTVITLSNLRRSLAFPDAGKLRRVLLREFGVMDDFCIIIDGERLTVEDLDARRDAVAITLPSGRSITGHFWITDKPRAVAEPGVLVRVNGRAIGSPSFFGVEHDRDVPKSIRDRVYGEFDADHLVDAVLPNWDDWVENSVEYRAFAEEMRSMLREKCIEIRDSQAGNSPEEFVESYRDQIDRLPPTRRELARAALLRVFSRFFEELPDRKHDIAEMVLDAFEQDEYWLLVHRIQTTPSADITALAEVLEEWGFLEINGIVTRARQRLVIIDQFESLIRDDKTLERKGVHEALEKNLWLLGDEYELLKSDVTLKNLIDDLFKKKYSGKRAGKRPDLFLGELNRKYVLVELKRPSEEIDRHHVAQAEEYRDVITPYLDGGRIDVIVIGGKVDPMLRADASLRVRVETFRSVLLGARRRCEWLTSNLAASSVRDDASVDDLYQNPITA